MGETGKNNLFELQGLAINFLSYIRMPVTVKRYPPATDTIKITFTISTYQVGAFTLFNWNRSGSMFLRRIWMPDYLLIPFRKTFFHGSAKIVSELIENTRWSLA